MGARPERQEELRLVGVASGGGHHGGRGGVDLDGVVRCSSGLPPAPGVREWGAPALKSARLRRFPGRPWAGPALAMLKMPAVLCDSEVPAAPGGGWPDKHPQTGRIAQVRGDNVGLFRTKPTPEGRVAASQRE